MAQSEAAEAERGTSGVKGAVRKEKRRRLGLRRVLEGSDFLPFQWDTTWWPYAPPVHVTTATRRRHGEPRHLP